MLNKLAIFRLWMYEFRKYSVGKLKNDLLAGLTVAAVALPLALAFGVASGATAAAGLVTAIIAGFLIGALSGAPYQISGPTGAMSAVLIVIVQKYGLPGLWMAGLMSGAIILALGLFKLGRIVNFIPAPVITGFTSGIALIILIGQVDNFLGIKTPAADSTLLKGVSYFTKTLPPINWQSVICGLIVMAVMIILPFFKITKKLPAALVGIAISTAVAWGMNWSVAVIGKIPATIFLDDRYNFKFDDFKIMGDLIGPATAIAALGAIESLLAGVVAGRMTGVKLDANQELVAQGVGNIVIPFFGGVPATAAIARMSVGIKSGGTTRLVTFVHAATLLFSALFLGEIIGKIPMAALAGVLAVTAHRMNEWHVIRFYLVRRLKSPSSVMLVTMLATITFDLTQAIIIGFVLSLLLFINQVARLDIVSTEVDWKRLREAGFDFHTEHPGIKVVYVTGSLFFGAAAQFQDTLESMEFKPVLILSMRGVPVIDASGLQALEYICDYQHNQGGILLITGLQPQVFRMFERAGLVDTIGADRFFWSADQAIKYACEQLENGLASNWKPGDKPAKAMEKISVSTMDES
jgi:SulP family sulfate permease